MLIWVSPASAEPETMVTPGVSCRISWLRKVPVAASVSAVTTDTLAGTSISRSLLRRAVTKISPAPSSAATACWAMAGVAAKIRPETPSKSRARRDGNSPPAAGSAPPVTRSVPALAGSARMQLACVWL